MTLDADSRTLSPLPDVLSHGLVAVSTFGLLSFFCSTSLFVLLTYRLLRWRRTTAIKTPINQFLFLIYNLLLAGKQLSNRLKKKFLSITRRYPTGNRLSPQHQSFKNQFDRSRNGDMLCSRLVRVDRGSRK